MPIPVLTTKLFIPPSPSNAVLRPRLMQRLNEGLRRKLILISAPAGFGKTTLASAWLAGYEGLEPKIHAAWVSLDEGDSDPMRFLTYVMATLQARVPQIGRTELPALQTSQPPPIESLLTTLLNEITAIPNQIILVLDDYHVVDNRLVDDALNFVLEHLPPNLHLVITTREDPDLPLARLRARGQLVELRASDLRFTSSETAEFLNQVMGLDLTEDDIYALETRTEGWIAGLQLAALSMQSQEDIPAFIQAFAGDHRYIMDYLVEEVLKCQSESTRGFLLQTAILDRLNGALCDAVVGNSPEGTGLESGSTRLEALRRGNFFLIPLDDQGHWYRYHHLFAEFLRAHLTAELPEQVPILHRRASEWYERHGLVADAVHHGLAAEDFARVADLVERVFPGMSRSRQEGILLGWLKALPEALVRERPVLCNLYAGALMQTGQMEGVETWLRAAERWLDHSATPRDQPQPAPAGMVVVNEDEYRRLPGAVSLHRAGQALMLGNVPGTIQHARRALELAPEDDDLRRGGALVLMGLVYWSSGDLAAAQRMYADGMTWLRRAGNISDVLGCALALADIVATRGQLRETMRIYEQALQLAAEQGTPTLRGTADMLVGMSEVYRELGDTPAALRCLLRSKDQGEQTGLPQNRYRWQVAMAHIRESEDDLDGALDLLDEAQRLYAGDFSPDVRPIAARKARLWAAQGRLGEALAWVREQGLSAADDLSYLREFEHITLARILLACYERGQDDQHLQTASDLLARLLKAAEVGERGRSAIEIRILQALALQAQGETRGALGVLRQALALAEPEGYVRIFVDEGRPVAQLLREVTGHENGSEPSLLAYAGRLLAAFEAASHGSTKQPALPNAPVAQPVQARSQAANPALVEPLSQRELDVLRLFRTELSGPEIAQELAVALSTVRTHTKSIYGKLNVNSRRAAVRRAAELKLI